MHQGAYKKIKSWLDANPHESPCLVMDLAAVRDQYAAITAALPFASCHYAVKANPGMPILKTLVLAGSNFDVATVQELEMCLAAGAKPDQILYSNTVKKSSEIAAAYAKGARVFTVDSEPELEKVAANAPESRIFIRMHTSGAGSFLPLSRKFGCNGETAIHLLERCSSLGLKPYGVAFHVGSQATELSPWEENITRAARIYQELESRGIKLEALNLGGGFPAQYRQPIPEIGKYGEYIKASLDRHFPGNTLKIIIEPGRFLVADAAILRSEVVLVSKQAGDERRWVYLDVGKFTGLVELEAIEYRLETAKDDELKVPVVIAGPTCDSVDVLYEESYYEMPVNLEYGDRILLLSAGAYTVCCSTTGFNGYPPLREYYLGG